MKITLETNIFKIFRKKRTKLYYERFIERSEAIRFLNSFNLEKEHERRHKLIFSILVFLGLRPAEACSLKLENFSQDFRMFTIKLAKTGQIKQRVVVDFLAEMIRDYVYYEISNIIKHKGYIFYVENNNSKHEHIQPQTLRWIVSRKRRELNIQDHIVHKDQKHYRFNVYSLRRYFITEIVNYTQNIKVAQNIIGHVKIDTTAGYVKRIPLEQERRILNDVFNSYIEKQEQAATIEINKE